MKAVRGPWLQAGHGRWSEDMAGGEQAPLTLWGWGLGGRTAPWTEERGRPPFGRKLLGSGRGADLTDTREVSLPGAPTMPGPGREADTRGALCHQEIPGTRVGLVAVAAGSILEPGPKASLES